MSTLDVWNKLAGCDIRRAALFHGLLYIFSYFKKASEADKNVANKQVVKDLCMLFGVNTILKNSAPIIEGGFIIPEHLSGLARLKEILL